MYFPSFFINKNSEVTDDFAEHEKYDKKKNTIFKCFHLKNILKMTI